MSAERFFFRLFLTGVSNESTCTSCLPNGITGPEEGEREEEMSGGADGTSAVEPFDAVGLSLGDAMTGVGGESGLLTVDGVGGFGCVGV